jgi:iron(III) transport system ATP-binding protein
MQSVGGTTSVVPYLRVRNLVKTFGTFTALDDVSLDVTSGEFVCFLGPSGCGKTTLLRCIAGLDPQTSGTIEQGSRDVSRLPPAARDFGIVFQSYALFPNLTVAANVGYGLTSRGRPKAETAERVATLLALVGLADQGAKFPGQLSGGQQQRVALARALATSPGLLLLDEPLSALDARVRVRLRQEIKDLQRRVGVTTIMVTHDQEEALTMADRIVVMNRGEIEQIGSPTEIYRDPASAFVADFIGAMTFMAAEALDATHVRVGPMILETAPYSIMRGSGVSVGIRPEEVRVRNLDAGAANRMDTRIDALEFLGAFARARLVLDVAPQMHVLADFSVNALRDLSLAAGQPLTIALPPETLRVFPASS